MLFFEKHYIWMVLCMGFAFSNLQADMVKGVVSAVQPDEGTLVFKDADGKTQEYFVGAGDLQAGYVGKTVRGESLKSGKSLRLENIWPNDEQSAKAVQLATNAIVDDTARRSRGSVFRKKGEAIPPFALWNQYGDLVRAENLKGKRLVLNFIFTRCKNPEMCPRQSTQMAKLQKDLSVKKIPDVQFLTITFDPDYDTPGILKSYADAREVDGSNYFFLTGPKEQINALMRQFGILTVREDGTINHNVATLLVGADGKILYRRDGPVWKSEDFISQLEKK
ncbi:MAG: SCO family protein [Puniceicoccales bacterium]|jgi:protein SCO1/2|nr:SCO family protein [Puniceicoccales bacterium]